jgi:hypothetical protein
MAEASVRPSDESPRTALESRPVPRGVGEASSDSSERGAGALAAPVGRSGTVWLGIGFLLFGFALGEVTGFSVAQGISQTLLSALFTFVGGVLLTFTGFRVRARAASNAVDIDPLRVGVGLGCFSLGVIWGTNVGVLTRCNVHLERLFLGEFVEHSRCMTNLPPAPETPPPPIPTTTGIGPQSGAGTECQKRRRDIEVDLGTCEEPVKMRKAFGEFVEQCGKP